MKKILFTFCFYFFLTNSRAQVLSIIEDTIKVFKIVQFDTSNNKINSNFLIAKHDSKYYFFDLNPFQYNYKCGCTSDAVLNFINNTKNSKVISKIEKYNNSLKLTSLRNIMQDSNQIDKVIIELIKKNDSLFVGTKYTYAIANYSIKAKFMKIFCPSKLDYLKKFDSRYFPSTIIDSIENSIILLDFCKIKKR